MWPPNWVPLVGLFGVLARWSSLTGSPECGPPRRAPRATPPKGVPRADSSNFGFPCCAPGGSSRGGHPGGSWVVPVCSPSGEIPRGVSTGRDNHGGYNKSVPHGVPARVFPGVVPEALPLFSPARHPWVHRGGCRGDPSFWTSSLVTQRGPPVLFPRCSPPEVVPQRWSPRGLRMCAPAMVPPGSVPEVCPPVFPLLGLPDGSARGVTHASPELGVPQSGSPGGVH